MDWLEPRFREAWDRGLPGLGESPMLGPCRLEPLMVAAAIGASAAAGLASSAIQSGAQGDAAATQAAAADRAAGASNAAYYQAREDLLPFVNQGVNAANMLDQFNFVDPNILAALSTPFVPTVDQLEQTPGYQFTRDQGLKAVQNSATARGQGISGNALRGAADYGTGLAQQTYGNEFDRYLRQNSQIFNMLLGANQGQFNQLLQRAQLGANAGAQVGSFGATAANQVGSAAIGAGNAQAAATVGQGNAIAQGLGNAGNSLLQYNMFSRLFPDTASGGSNYISPALYPNLASSGPFTLAV